MAARVTHTHLMKEAWEQLHFERSHVKEIRLSFMDSVIESLCGPRDKVAMAHASDGLHVFVNGEHKGFFVKEKLGLVWRTAYADRGSTSRSVT